jgi:hypothetical protein
MDCKEQARKIYEVCISSAKVKRTITYQEVLNSLGYADGISGNAIRYGLELVLITCADQGLPKLTSIVVNKSTGEPSPNGLTVDLSVFVKKEWPAVNKIDWIYYWNKRKQLSHKYGTPGYWSK